MLTVSSEQVKKEMKAVKAGRTVITSAELLTSLKLEDVTTFGWGAFVADMHRTCPWIAATMDAALPPPAQFARQLRSGSGKRKR